MLTIKESALQALKSYISPLIILVLICAIIPKIMYAQNFDPPTEHLKSELLSSEEPIKCLTSHILEFERNPKFRQWVLNNLSSELAQHIAGLSDNMSVIQSQATYLSPSGRFTIQYDTTGTLAVPLGDLNGSGIPDYIELTAQFADSSWNHLVGTLGYKDPVPDLNSPIRIIFHNNNNIYGSYAAETRTIRLHKNFVGFEHNQHGQSIEDKRIGALMVTIAHELKHAIQHATRCFNSFACNSPSLGWLELDATMAEEIVFPSVKDYLNYIVSSGGGQHAGSIFRNPGGSVPNLYFHVTYGLYFRERFDDEFWVNVWDALEQNLQLNMFAAIYDEIRNRGYDPQRETMQMYMWHYASGGGFRQFDYGFSSKGYYPGMRVTNWNFDIHRPWASAWMDIGGKSAVVYEIPREVLWNNEDEIVVGFFQEPPNLMQPGRIHGGFLSFNHDGKVVASYFDDIEQGFQGTFHRGNYTFTGAIQYISGISNISRAIAFFFYNDSAAIKRGQIIFGSLNRPSPYRLGTFPGNGSAVDHASKILDMVIGPAAEINDHINGPAQFLSVDVSGNQSISALDASLILKRNNGVIDRYPADSTGTDYLPAGNWFPPFVLEVAATPMAKTRQQNFAQNSPDLSLRTFFGDPDGQIIEDDTLRVYVELDKQIDLSSATLVIEFDSTVINFAGIDVPGVESSSVLSRYRYTYNSSTSRTQLHLAYALDTVNTSINQALVLYFNPKVDVETITELTLRSLQLDESYVYTKPVSVSETVVKNEGVGVRPPSQLPHATRLMPNYPNPFNPTTNLMFELSEPGFVSIDVFDIAGRRLRTIEPGQTPAGSHRVTFDASTLSSGIYVVRMTVQSSSGSSQMFSRSITLLK